MSAMYMEPFRAYHFKLEIQGIEAGLFTECTGIGARVETIPYRSGGEGQRVHKLVGNVDYDPVILRYGLTAHRALWDWMKDSLRGVVERRPLSLIYLQPDGVTEQARYNLFEAWPSRWRAAPLDAMERQVAIAEIEVEYEYMEQS